MSDQPETPPNALVAEAMTKSGVLWIEVAGDRTWPAWHVWGDGRAYVVSGPGEQPLPGCPRRSPSSCAARTRAAGS